MQLWFEAEITPGINAPEPSPCLGSVTSKGMASGWVGDLPMDSRNGSQRGSYGGVLLLVWTVGSLELPTAKKRTFWLSGSRTT